MEYNNITKAQYDELYALPWAGRSEEHMAIVTAYSDGRELHTSQEWLKSLSKPQEIQVVLEISESGDFERCDGAKIMFGPLEIYRNIGYDWKRYIETFILGFLMGRNLISK